ncbi:hypothetical protein N0O92_23140 [Alkalihalobacillus sp. MEB130]|uniref:hypothetical protein n=1 Tax=Alkalihalobacillus sp. MEB130 TaxID=2976704 RepID=UPI0028DFC45F|nr:hypothetical protein [Alkalihalobacillus sp. MEB130]MDT8863051.1 hypothetical protein [Alkalihalobacillus sp. MEB130]
MKEDEKGLYGIMLVGAIGTVLILVGSLQFIEIENMNGFMTILFGFLLTITYINYLESKAGVRKRLIVMRVIFSIVLLAVLAFIFF